MAELTFYRQKRVDGGVRTGIDLNGSTVFDRFEEGEPEPDPALLWYVDLRCRGPKVPATARACRKWLVDHEKVIRNGFQACANELIAGIDPDLYPLVWEKFSNLPAGVQMAIAYSAVRRIDAIRMSEVVRDIGTHWLELVRSLKPVQPVQG
jgi:hypothetical protein